MTEICVLIVEDEPLIAEDIAACLGQVDYTVSAIAYDKAGALHTLATQRADIVLLDLNLEGGLEGIDIATHINEQYHLPFVFLTSYADRQVLDKVKPTRPMGYLVKPFDEKDLFAALEIALYNFAHTRKPARLTLAQLNEQLLSPLTVKEFEVLLDLYEGRTNKQIGDRHFISLNTVKTHLKNLYDKLQVHTRTEALQRVRTLAAPP
ncbi:MAG: hypothetical protein OHK0039_35570 [Bacteroidia bacterium]